MKPSYAKKLQLSAILAFSYFVLNIVGSGFSGSLALLADAGHKFADLSAITLALLASHLAHSALSPRKTFGFHRAEVLAAFINSLLLFSAGCFILWEVFQRLNHHTHVHIEGGWMMGISLVGLLINIVSAVILFPEREINLNVKGAFLHVSADIANSCGEILTAAAIFYFNVTWLDSILSSGIALVVMLNALKILKDAVLILMEAAPEHIAPQQIQQFLLDCTEVLDVHDLHLWTITTGREALMAHIKVEETHFNYETAQKLEQSLRDHFDLCHISLQLEPRHFQEQPAPF